MSKKEPAYDRDEFFDACKEGLAYINDESREGAKELFNFDTEDQINEFLGHRGFDTLELDDSTEYRKWMGSPPKPLADSYVFSSARGKNVAISHFGRIRIQVFGV